MCNFVAKMRIPMIWPKVPMTRQSPQWAKMQIAVILLKSQTVTLYRLAFQPFPQPLLLSLKEQFTCTFIDICFSFVVSLVLVFFIFIYVSIVFSLEAPGDG